VWKQYTRQTTILQLPCNIFCRNLIELLVNLFLKKMNLACRKQKLQQQFKTRLPFSWTHTTCNSIYAAPLGSLPNTVPVNYYVPVHVILPVVTLVWLNGCATTAVVVMLSLKPRSVTITFLLLSLWCWPSDLCTLIWPVSSEDVRADQKLTFQVEAFESCHITDIHAYNTYIQTDATDIITTPSCGW